MFGCLKQMQEKDCALLVRHIPGYSIAVMLGMLTTAQSKSSPLIWKKH